MIGKTTVAAAMAVPVSATHLQQQNTQPGKQIQKQKLATLLLSGWAAE
jgi:hypothetical protein